MSPVIGVILMVAITVILAAVIATFVLGLGDQADEQPQASFGFDYNSGGNLSEPNATVGPNGSDVNDGAIVINHQSGDNIKAEELRIRGSNVATGIWDGGPSTSGDSLEGEASDSFGSQSAVVAGDSVSVEAYSNYTVRVIYQPLPTGDSAELASDTGPDA